MPKVPPGLRLLAVLSLLVAAMTAAPAILGWGEVPAGLPEGVATASSVMRLVAAALLLVAVYGLWKALPRAGRGVATAYVLVAVAERAMLLVVAPDRLEAWALVGFVYPLGLAALIWTAYRTAFVR